MGLPAALKAHSKSDLKLAGVHYRRALEQKDFKDVLFQNYGALLRSESNNVEAEKIYCPKIWVKESFVSKYFLNPRNFESEKIWIPKRS